MATPALRVSLGQASLAGAHDVNQDFHGALLPKGHQLASKGIAPDSVLTSGQGPDRPVASNVTVDGRARNRRIEFRIAQ